MRASTKLLSVLIVVFSILLADHLMLNRSIVSQVTRTARQSSHRILSSARPIAGTGLAAVSLFSTTPNNMGLFSGNKNQVDSEHAPKEPAVKKSDSEWQAQLSPEQFRVLRKQGTERPGTGKYDKFKEEGIYRECPACFPSPQLRRVTSADLLSYPIQVVPAVMHLCTSLRRSLTPDAAGQLFLTVSYPLSQSHRISAVTQARLVPLLAIPGAVGRNVDRSMFMERIEIVCNNCKLSFSV